MEHLADLLRNGLNSQLYPSIYESWRPKIVEALKNQAVRRLLWDDKVPGTSVGTRAAAASGPETARPAAGFLEESQVNGSLPCQTGRIE